MANQPAYRALDGALPQNIEAEQAVLGSLLIDARAIDRVASFLRPDDFYLPVNGEIFRGMLALYEQDSPTDVVTVTAHLSAQGRLDDTGGAGYLASLATLVPTSINAEHYARIVEKLAVLRRLIDAGNRIAGIGYDERREADDALEEAERVLFDISRQRVTRDFEPLGRILADVYEQLDHIHSHESTITGVTSGFIDLDRLTSGFQRSDLLVLAGRPSMGKTGLALNIAHAVGVKAKLPVGIFSIEMSAEQLAHRFLAMHAQIDSQRLRTGRMSDVEWDRLIEAVGILSEAPIFIDDTPALSTVEMRSKARRLHSEQGLGLIIVDYLQLMQGVSSENRVQEISAISRGLKQVARELDVPVLALSQLSRAPDQRPNHEPMLSDLRESGCLTADTQVYLPDLGVYRRMDEMVSTPGARVLALDPSDWTLSPRRVLKAFCTGRKTVFKLTTTLGRVIRATGNHRFLTVDGWKRLDELGEDDRIAVPRHLPNVDAPSMSLAEVALLGHLIGDGCVLPSHVIQYTTNDLELGHLVAELATTVFGDRIRPRVSAEREWCQVYLPASERLTHRVHNPIIEWFGRLGICGLRSHQKFIPDAVFRQPRGHIATFLRHLWATDGCIHLSHGAKHYANVYFASSSARLVTQVQSLLLRLGINATVRAVSQGNKGRAQHHVIVSGRDDIERFLSQIGSADGKKQAHAAAIHEYFSSRNANTNRDVIPRTVWHTVVRPAMLTAGVRTRQLHAALDSAYCGSTLYRSNISRARAVRVVRAVGSPTLERLARSDVYWDGIRAIDPDGEEDVYDLTVEGLHNFVAGDIVVHNSIEQDSDIVMFIYRDVVYNKETERPHVADIIVAKHRNGPTGTIHLYYQDALMRFLDLSIHES